MNYDNEIALMNTMSHLFGTGTTQKARMKSHVFRRIISENDNIRTALMVARHLLFAHKSFVFKRVSALANESTGYI